MDTTQTDITPTFGGPGRIYETPAPAPTPAEEPKEETPLTAAVAVSDKAPAEGKASTPAEGENPATIQNQTPAETQENHS